MPVQVQVQVQVQVRVQVQLPGVMCVYLHSVSQSFPHGHECVRSSHTSEYIFLPVLPCERFAGVECCCGEQFGLPHVLQCVGCQHGGPLKQEL